MDGVINIYKEQGYTSHDVVAKVRKILNCKRVGHTGTLDPDAEGVLPICVGKATKIAEYLSDEWKFYQAEVTLGIVTTTEDISGEILETKQVDFNENNIKEVVYSFKGEYMQTPPMYSAIKINGERLYKLAREGKTIDRSPRKVEIKSIDIIEFLPPNRFKINVTCSKGTYIRTLCSDIGQKLNCGACMSALVRTKVASLELSNSINLESLKQYKENQDLDSILIKIEDILSKFNFSKVYTKKSVFKNLCNGNVIPWYGIEQSKDLQVNSQVLVYDYENNFIGVYKVILDTENKVFIKPVKFLI